MPAEDIAAQLDTHRGYLLRVAKLQLRDEALGEPGHVQAVGGQEIGADRAVPTAVTDHGDASPAR